MNIYRLFLPFFLFFLFLTVSSLLVLNGAMAEAVQNVCGVSIEVEEGRKIKFTSNERLWLCGKKESAAWNDIPLTQKTFFLKSFLQSRGYLNPQFSTVNDILKVKTGKISKVKALNVSGSPSHWNWRKRRRLLNRTLNPNILNEVQVWTKRQLQYRGYPCPQVSTTANWETGEIEVVADPGAYFSFGEYQTVGNQQLPVQTLDRFTAFIPGDVFDIRLLELTSNRILQEDIYLNAFFDVMCDPSGPPRIVRRLVPAQKRLVVLGVGFDTEEGPLVKANFKRTRMGTKANHIEGSAFASLREQSLLSEYHHYLSSDLSSRFRLVPSLLVRREDESKFATVLTKVGVGFGYGWEESSFQPHLQIGPYIQRNDTLRGEGPRRTDSFVIASEIRLTDHLFEYYVTEPQMGWNLLFDSSSTFGTFELSQTTHRLAIQHHWLWNLGNWDPPFLILGWRSYSGTLLVNKRRTATIPLNQRFFLGGNVDLRGFSRQSIGDDQGGFLTTLYQGFELRAGEWFNIKIQPFLLFDMAWTGTQPTALDAPFYYSPGLGIRYASPFGPLRATAARGLIANPNRQSAPGHNQFYFSFGREF